MSRFGHCAARRAPGVPPPSTEQRPFEDGLGVHASLTEAVSAPQAPGDSHGGAAGVRVRVCTLGGGPAAAPRRGRSSRVLARKGGAIAAAPVHRAGVRTRHRRRRHETQPKTIAPQIFVLKRRPQPEAIVTTRRIVSPLSGVTTEVYPLRWGITASRWAEDISGLSTSRWAEVAITERRARPDSCGAAVHWC